MNQTEPEIHWQPNPGPQTNALKKIEYEVLYGGARGGGKTDAGIAWLLYPIHIPQYRGLAIRRNAEDLVDWLDRAEEMYRAVGGVRSGKPAVFKFPSGAKIRTGHLKDDKAYTKYQGHEYQRMEIEELTHIAREENYLKLLGSCRSTIPGLDAQIFCTTNPGEVGHKWVKERWHIDMALPPAEIRCVDDKTERPRVFVSAKVTDCPQIVNNDPDYIKFLEGLPSGLKEQWRDGSWAEYEVAGAYYTAVIAEATKDNRIANIPYLQNYPVDTYWDIGKGSHLAIWFCQTVGYEIHFIDYLSNCEDIQEVALELQERNYIYGTHYMPHDGDPEQFNTGKSLKETAEKIGITPILTVPKISVEAGINAVKMIFKQCYFDMRNCEDGLDSLRNYHRKFDADRGCWKKKPYDNLAAHAADAFRYFAVGYRRMPRRAAKIGGGVTIDMIKKHYPKRGKQKTRRSATGY